MKTIFYKNVQGLNNVIEESRTLRKTGKLPYIQWKEDNTYSIYIVGEDK